MQAKAISDLSHSERHYCFTDAECRDLDGRQITERYHAPGCRPARGRIIGFHSHMLLSGVMRPAALIEWIDAAGNTRIESHLKTTFSVFVVVHSAGACE